MRDEAGVSVQSVWVLQRQELLLDFDAILSVSV
jgi:hypothetical protein